MQNEMAILEQEKADENILKLAEEQKVWYSFYPSVTHASFWSEIYFV